MKVRKIKEIVCSSRGMYIRSIVNILKLSTIAEIHRRK